MGNHLATSLSNCACIRKASACAWGSFRSPNYSNSIGLTSLSYVSSLVKIVLRPPHQFNLNRMHNKPTWYNCYV